MVEAVPPGGTVGIPRDWLAGELEAVQTSAKLPAAESEAWLSAAEVAAQLATSVRWVYDHAKQLGGKQLSPRCVRFSPSGVRRYLERRG